jgi:hypothetical protein
METNDAAQIASQDIRRFARRREGQSFGKICFSASGWQLFGLPAGEPMRKNSPDVSPPRHPAQRGLFVDGT